MKEKFLKIQFLLYAAVLFIIASALENYLSGLKSYEIDSARIEKLLHAKEKGLDSAVARIKSIFKSGENLRKENNIYLIDKPMPELKAEGLSVLVYKNDTLCYWSENSAANDKVFSQSALNNRIVNINNVWYELRTYFDGEYTYAGLIFLKNKYNFSNKYLKNEFPEEFNLGASVQVSMIPLSYSFDIADDEGKYLFSLVPTNSYDSDGENFNIVGVLFFLALVMLMAFFYSFSLNLSANEGNKIKFIVLIGVFVLSRIAMLVLKIPANVYSLDFFDPVYFSAQPFFPTLGDFIVNSEYILTFITIVFKFFDYIGLKEKLSRVGQASQIIAIAVGVVVAALIFIPLYILNEQLVFDSRISFRLNNITSLDIFSFAGILIFVVNLASFLVYVIKATNYINLNTKIQLQVAAIIIAGATFGLSFMFGNSYGLHRVIAVLFAGIIILSACCMHYSKSEGSVYRYIFMIFVSAVFTTEIIIAGNEQKLDAECRNLVTYPADEHDPVAELLLNRVGEKLPGDAMIADFLRKKDRLTAESRLRDYLQQQYFNGYWSKYNLSLKLIELVPGQIFSNLDDEFVKNISTSSEVPGTGFYFIDKSDGEISYAGVERYIVDSRTNYVCILLESKPVPQELGYPELLMDKNVKPTVISGYDYAKYRNGRKISQNGKYSYDLSDSNFAALFKNEQSEDIIATTSTTDGYIHTVYKNNSGIVVLSRRNVTFIDCIITFAYLFVVYIAILLVVLIIRLMLKHDNAYLYQLKTRLVFSVAFILVVSFVFICVGSAYFNVARFKNENRENIDEKMKSVYMGIEQTFGKDTIGLNRIWNPNENSSIDDYLTNMSHIFFIDINLYNPDGELIASSRPEIFKQGLAGTRMDNLALNSLVIENKANYIQDEHIGKLSFTSAYIPFYNYQDKLTAYINLPYFTRPDVMKAELYTLIVSIINLYVVLMMVSIVLAVVIGERIVQPLKLIQNKFEKIELGKKHEKIEYNRKDELGQLVSEYNKMAEKLEESANLLAQNERESAWREMAKQIAHEIKNPLTPMKLSIQFLMRSKQNNADNFDGILQKVSNTLIQQIDTLSSIATEFSNFAKMPKPDAHPFNVVEILSNVIQLFNNEENIDITNDFGGKEEVVIVADKEQISRVFINLIKNATQAIPDGIRGHIHVSLSVEEKLEIRFKDNGSGIPEEIRSKLFTPNFTTKSSGSGLGLAMCKNIVMNAGGTITFESEVGKGTTFIVTLPLKK